MLTDKKLIEVAKLGIKLQKYCYFPQEVHFAIEKNKIFITQTKPITLQAQSVILRQSSGQERKVQNHKINHFSKLLLLGTPAYPGIATGHLRIVQSAQDINRMLRGDIIVIPYQDLIKRPIPKAGAIVATDDRLHQTLHLALGPFFSGKPTIVAKPNAISVLKNGAVVTVNGKSGEVYVGSN